MKKRNLSYSQAINEAFIHILSKNKNSYIIGQGLWSPWYVGSTMNDLEKKFGTKRVIDTPVSEAALTGMALGSSIHGMKPIVIHPRMDFAILAMDQIFNQSNNWNIMFGGNSKINICIRAIINRGGSQGAQHSQDLHSIFSHFPNLKVFMPYSPIDAYNMLISSIYMDGPSIYIDDRWLYSEVEEFSFSKNYKIKNNFEPKIINKGNDITLISCGYSTKVAKNICDKLKLNQVNAELIDLRQINPLNFNKIIKSIKKTKRYVVLDGSWSFCGLSDSIIANIEKRIDFKTITKPISFNIFDSSAPTSEFLETHYYLNQNKIYNSILKLF